MTSFKTLDDLPADITGKRLREAEERLENMAFKGIPARLASLLRKRLNVTKDSKSDLMNGNS